jgi:hypothetical protein
LIKDGLAPSMYTLSTLYLLRNQRAMSNPELGYALRDLYQEL